MLNTLFRAFLSNFVNAFFQFIMISRNKSINRLRAFSIPIIVIIISSLSTRLIYTIAESYFLGITGFDIVETSELFRYSLLLILLILNMAIQYVLFKFIFFKDVKELNFFKIVLLSYLESTLALWLIYSVVDVIKFLVGSA